MTFHHNIKKNLFHISTNIPAFSGMLADQRAQRPISLPPVKGGLRLYGAPGWNLETGPFLSIYEKLNERIEVLVLLKQIKLEQKKESLASINHNINETHGFSKQYNVCIKEIISFHLRVVFGYVTLIFCERF